jgi:hypothetical protein
MQLQAIVDGATKVPENPFDRIKMRLSWVVHVQADLLNGIGDVRAGER